MFAGRMPLNSNWLESPGWGWATSLPWQTNNRRLLGELCRSALRSLTRYFEVLAGRELMPGVIAAIQTFGDRINLHPHLHFLVTEGGVDEAGAFHKISRIDMVDYELRPIPSRGWAEMIRHISLIKKSGWPLKPRLSIFCNFLLPGEVRSVGFQGLLALRLFPSPHFCSPKPALIVFDVLIYAHS
jgi:Putative transposase